jgi:hypothetical protein
MAMRLDAYVSHQCVNCREALETADQARAIPHLTVAVINLDDAGKIAPSNVIAEPTYLLDDRVVSLGNPDRESFLVERARRAKERMR